MKKKLVFLLCFVFFAPQGHQIFKGTVVVVYDGDTVKVRSDSGAERRVRLIGIDTPEIEAESAATRLEALLAKRFTFYHLFRRSVKLSYDREIEDKYGRLLAYIWTDDRLFNTFILEEGFARVYRKFPFGMEAKFVRAQQRAKERGKGFWHEGPYPEILAGQVQHSIGSLIRVRFVCTRIRKSGSLLFIQGGGGGFAALIPEEYLFLFDDIQMLEGKTLQVFGFLEEYGGQPQIMIFFPTQLQLVGD